jgi:hypothetical protein
MKKFNLEKVIYMEYIFFYVSMFLTIMLFFICTYFKKPSLPSIIIGLTSIGYSFISDLTFGDRLKLFYYITPQKSTLYIILAGVFIYSFYNIIYTMFLPESNPLIYTIFWIIGMLMLEYLSLIARTVVFTGWKMFPWSIILYMVSYLWIYSFYKYLLNKIPVSKNY